jgi:hypothetical protein
MRYVLLIGGSADASADAAAEVTSKETCDTAESIAWVEELTQRGAYHGGEVLRPPSDAKTVRVRDGEVLLSDGPFAETKEQMGGLSVIECADLDEAIKIAAAHPVARSGMIEVRPVWE